MGFLTTELTQIRALIQSSQAAGDRERAPLHSDEVVPLCEKDAISVAASDTHSHDHDYEELSLGASTPTLSTLTQTRH